MTSDPDFKVTTFFEVEYRKKDKVKDKVTIAQEVIMPNIIWNITMFSDLD